MTKQNALASVKQSISSIFSKDDVLYLISLIEVGSSRKITTNDIDIAIDKVISWAEHNEEQLLDLDSAELEMNYDYKVKCVGVPINVDSLREALENNFMDFGEVEVEIEPDIKE